jgi:crotonobetaine/carnitine-CoA ligase
MPEPERCVSQGLINQANKECPDRVFALFEDGEQWTYADLYHRVRSRAAGLQALGVEPGDRVLVWLPNGAPILLTWCAINYIGATYVPINTAYRGQLLEHVVANSGARLMVSHSALIDRLEHVDCAQLEKVVAIGKPATSQVNGVQIEEESALYGDASNLKDIGVVMPWDLQSIIYTSGTTGPSKGVMSTYFHQYTIATVAHGYMGRDDRIMVNMPMFHISGTGAAYAALVRQGSLAMFEGFKTTMFWSQVRETGCTLTCGLVGSMAQFLEKNEPQPDDAENPLKMALLFPISKTTKDLAKRYDFSYVSGFGMTELPIVMTTDIDCPIDGTCGKPRSGVECRLVDENDIEVARGQIGELIVRSDQPWSLIHGYNNMPGATAEAWRNGWFHTGDLFRQDEDGNFYYVDRRKDSIRRRGENISSQEVENAVFTYPAVNDVAAVAVPSEHGEDEVLILVAPKPGLSIDPVELFEFLRLRMAHFMLPRYIRVEEALPQTPTNKVRKYVLREQGVTENTWDREAAGIIVKKDRLN